MLGKQKSTMYLVRLLVLSLAVVGTFRAAVAQSKLSFDGFKLVDRKGDLSTARLPGPVSHARFLDGARSKGQPGSFHLYASPGAAEYYRRNKEFGDGTVLVKEINGTDHGQMTNGNVNWATNTNVWFVLIKDSKGRHPNNPLWGEGWGWALFKADAPDKQVATDYKKDCLG